MRGLLDYWRLGPIQSCRKKGKLDDIEKFNVKVANEKMTKEKILNAFVLDIPDADNDVGIKAAFWDENDLDVQVQYRVNRKHAGRSHLYIYYDPKIDGYVCSFSLMELEAGFQSQGYGHKFFKRLETNLKSWGVKEIRLFADLDVGGYAWARFGFDFLNAQARKMTVNGFIRVLNLEYNIQEDADKFNHPWEVAVYKGPNGEPIGKKFLLGQTRFMTGHDWLASKTLDENSLGWKVGEDYERSKAKVGTATA